jgi:ATP-dependent RNA helicase DeaD
LALCADSPYDAATPCGFAKEATDLHPRANRDVAFLSTIPAISRALAERNYDSATPVQAAVLEANAAGGDLLVSAQTGSGKTVAYGLAIAVNLFDDSGSLGPPAEPLALIIAPTRELALQVQRELAWLYQYAGARVISCVGGMEPRAERRLLAAGAQIVIGTPGRLRDHIERGALDVSKLKAVVLDEADEMLDLGFREDLEFILETTPQERRTLLFSATLPKGIAALAKRFQRDALRIEVAGGDRGHADIEYRAVRVAPNEIEHAVVNVLRQADAPGALVFCNTREAVRHLQAILLERGFAAVLLSGELSQNERNHALQALRDGRARVCVATDVAARGIDLPGLALVIHADLPHDAEILQHRSGRTGRAGRKGVSVLLIPNSRRRRAEQLMATAGIEPVWSAPPSADEIRKLDHERLLQDPLLTEESSEDDIAMARALLAERSAEDIAAALARVYRARLPVPEDVRDPGQGPEPRAPRGAKPAGRESAPRSRTDGVWFRLDIGSKKNADPKWLLPMLCRRGKITRQDIGAIRIFERETKFEVSGAVAREFLANVRRPDGDPIRIEPATEGFERPADKRVARGGYDPAAAHEKRPRKKHGKD